MKPGDGEAYASPSARRRSKPRVAPQDLPLPERRRIAGEKALDLLARRERSEVEIRLALRRKGFDADTIAVVVGSLQERGLLSDQRFADAYSREAAARRGYASAAIRSQLRGKGVSSEIAAVAATAAPEEELERARAVAGKRARALATLPREVRLRRLAGFLARRGYPSEIAFRVARELGGDAPDQDPADADQPRRDSDSEML